MSAMRRSLIPDLDECPCAGGTLDKLTRPAALVLLAGEDLHGYAIVQRMGRMAMFQGTAPDAAGVYRTLRSLSRQGLLSCQWDVSGAGPAKRRYQITPAGRKCLARWAGTLEQYRVAIGELLSLVRGAGAAGAASCGCRGGGPGGRGKKARRARRSATPTARKGEPAP